MRFGVLLALLAVLAAPASAAAPRHIAFVGDSLSVGLFASTEQRGYVALVESKLGAANTYSVAAKSGVRASYWHPASVPAGEDAIVIELGTNDLDHTSVAAFGRIYKRLIVGLLARSPHAKLVCLGVWQTAHSVNVPRYNAKIQAACAAGTFVNLSPIFDRTTDRGPQGASTWAGPRDDFHPNDAGHRAIAAAVERALR